MQGFGFINQFFQHPREVGACTESSRALAQKMAEEIAGSTNVVEFGAGTGTVTREILRYLPEKGRLTCFEVNPQFYKELEKINDSRLRVVNDDARNWDQYVDNVECIVSGLPLTLFDKATKKAFFDIAKSAGKYVQLQYLPFLRQTLKKNFPEVRTKFVPQNFPPAFVFVCRP